MPDEPRQGREGQKKELSPVIKAVSKHNPEDLAKWREDHNISEDSEGWKKLAYKKRPEVNNIMQVGPKSFWLGSQSLLDLVRADDENEISSTALESLKTDVFDKTSEAIAKEEKKKAEEKEKREKGKKEEKSAWAWTEDRNPKVHSIHEFVSSMIPWWAVQVLQEWVEFENSLEDDQRRALSEKFVQGIPENQVGDIVSASNLAARKALAQALELI